MPGQGPAEPADCRRDVAIILGASFLRRLGKAAMVLGVVAGTAFAVFAGGRLLVEAQPALYGYENFFNFLLVVAAISCVSGGTWAVILCVALVRQAQRSLRAVV